MLSNKRDNPQLAHHTSAETELNVLRDLYLDLKALQGFCELNSTGTLPFVERNDSINHRKSNIQDATKS
jgi:hypothetical protein